LAYAELGGVRAEYDVVRSGVKGMVVHFSFIIRGARPGSDQFTIMGWFIIITAVGPSRVSWQTSLTRGAMPA